MCKWLDAWQAQLNAERLALDPCDDLYSLKCMKAKSKADAMNVFRDPFEAVENWLKEQEKEHA